MNNTLEHHHGYDFHPDEPFSYCQCGKMQTNYYYNEQVPHHREPRLTMRDYLTPMQGECYCGHKPPKTLPHIAGLLMHIHYQWTHVHKGK